MVLQYFTCKSYKLFCIWRERKVYLEVWSDCVQMGMFRFIWKLQYLQTSGLFYKNIYMRILQLSWWECRSKGKSLHKVLYMDQGPELLEIISIYHQTRATDETVFLLECSQSLAWESYTQLTWKTSLTLLSHKLRLHPQTHLSKISYERFVCAIQLRAIC